MLGNCANIKRACAKVIQFCLVVMAWACLSTASAQSVSKAYEIETDNFLFVGDIDRQRARALVEDLERYRSVLLQSFGLAYETETVKVRIYFAATNDQFAKMTGRAGAGGLYIRQLSGPIFIINGYDGLVSDKGIRKVAYHEFTHHMLETYYDGLLPLWYNEGLAEYYSSFTRSKDGRFEIGQVDRMNVKMLQQFEWVDMRRLLESVRDYPFDTMTAQNSQYSFVDFFYAQSWLAAHYFQSNASARRSLKRFFEIYDPTQDGQSAFIRAFGKSYSQFEFELRDYLRKGEFRTRKIGSRSVTRGALRVRPLTEGERALFVADITREIDAETMNIRSLEQLYMRAAMSGRMPDVTAGRAAIADEQGDTYMADHLMDRAVRLAPYNPRITTASAVMTLRRNLRQPKADRRQILPAREFLRRAIISDPQNMKAHYYYALSFVMVDEAPSPQALRSARKAVDYFRSNEFIEQNFYLTPVFIHFRDYKQARENIDKALMWSRSAPVKRDALRLKTMINGR